MIWLAVLVPLVGVLVLAMRAAQDNRARWESAEQRIQARWRLIHQNAERIEAQRRALADISRWNDGSNVRFREGKPQTIAGWGNS